MPGWPARRPGDAAGRAAGAPFARPGSAVLLAVGDDAAGRQARVLPVAGGRARRPGRAALAAADRRRRRGPAGGGEAFAPLGRRIAFAGSLSPDALLDCYAAADLYVWPALREAWGMTLLEAQASGLPVVAGAEGGVPAVVADGVTGLSTPPGDVAAFRAAIVCPARRSGERDMMAARKAATSLGGVKSPVTPSATTAGTPPRHQADAPGRPLAWASSKVRPGAALANVKVRGLADQSKACGDRLPGEGNPTAERGERLAHRRPRRRRRRSQLPGPLRQAAESGRQQAVGRRLSPGRVVRDRDHAVAAGSSERRATAGQPRVAGSAVPPAA